MSEIAQDALSRDAWQRRNDDDFVLPPVMFFDQKKRPRQFDDSGDYIGYIDFLNVQRQLRIQDVPLTTFYHAYVHYFAQDYPELADQARRHLHHNPYNSSAWNVASWTRHYFLNTDMLPPYAEEPVTPEYKIPGIGRIGRKVLRVVLFDEDPIEHWTT